MALRKIRRHDISIDMAAMCDVAFILLAFFILISRSVRLNSIVEINTPRIRHHFIADPESDIGTILIKDNKVFFKLDEPALQKQMLMSMALKYNIHFTNAEINKFSEMNGFGGPITELKTLIQSYGTLEQKQYPLKGIPIDNSKNNEFYNWVKQAREICRMQTEKELRFVINGDEAETYPIIKLVIANLQLQDINKFSLLVRF